MHHQCNRSENFLNTIMLLKVYCFKGFSNRSNIDELVISSTSGCNCNNYKFNNNNSNQNTPGVKKVEAKNLKKAILKKM